MKPTATFDSSIFRSEALDAYTRAHTPSNEQLTAVPRWLHWNCWLLVLLMLLTFVLSLVVKVPVVIRVPAVVKYEAAGGQVVALIPSRYRNQVSEGQPLQLVIDADFTLNLVVEAVAPTTAWPSESSTPIYVTSTLPRQEHTLLIPEVAVGTVSITVGRQQLLFQLWPSLPHKGE